jgi:hypothetical protein
VGSRYIWKLVQAQQDLKDLETRLTQQHRVHVEDLRADFAKERTAAFEAYIAESGSLWLPVNHIPVVVTLCRLQLARRRDTKQRLLFVSPRPKFVYLCPLKCLSFC